MLDVVLQSIVKLLYDVETSLTESGLDNLRAVISLYLDVIRDVKPRLLIIWDHDDAAAKAIRQSVVDALPHWRIFDAEVEDTNRYADVQYNDFGLIVTSAHAPFGDPELRLLEMHGYRALRWTMLTVGGKQAKDADWKRADNLAKDTFRKLTMGRCWLTNIWHSTSECLAFFASVRPDLDREVFVLRRIQAILEVQRSVLRRQVDQLEQKRVGLAVALTKGAEGLNALMLETDKINRWCDHSVAGLVSECLSLFSGRMDRAEEQLLCLIQECPAEEVKQRLDSFLDAYFEPVFSTLSSNLEAIVEHLDDVLIRKLAKVRRSASNQRNNRPAIDRLTTVDEHAEPEWLSSDLSWMTPSDEQQYQRLSLELKDAASKTRADLGVKLLIASMFEQKQGISPADRRKETAGQLDNLRRQLHKTFQQLILKTCTDLSELCESTLTDLVHVFKANVDERRNAMADVEIQLSYAKPALHATTSALGRVEAKLDWILLLQQMISMGKKVTDVETADCAKSG